MSEISQKQLEANRKNAKLGGVKTGEGKQISCKNALKHGILSQEVLLGDEDENALIELGKALRKELEPRGEIQLLLVDMLTADTWRLKRSLKVEKNMMEWHKHFESSFGDLATSYVESGGQKERKGIKDMIDNKSTENILRYQTTIRRNIFRCLHELQNLKNTPVSTDK